jgi:outer membrane protein OmpA-like peptidoglycan-associated protein
MRRSGRRWLLAFPLALVLGVTVLPLAKGSVDDALAAQAREALSTAGVAGVTVVSDWAGLTLSGPAERRTAALAAVDGMPDRSAVDTVVYRSEAVAAPVPSPSPSPTPPPTVLVEVAVTVAASGDERVVEVEGTVAGEQQRSALLAAVTSWAPSATLEDDVLVADGLPTDAVRAAFPSFLRIAGRAAGTFSGGEVRLGEQGIDVEGTTPTEDAAAAVRSLGEEAAGRGITVEGAARGPVTVVREQLSAVDDLEGVEFERGSERLTETSRRTLTRAARVLKSLPSSVVVEIRGHTDAKGPADLNERLSRRRAAEVRDYLVDKGVPAKRLRAVGLGEKDPLRPNDTASGRAANRRIEFVVKES